MTTNDFGGQPTSGAPDDHTNDVYGANHMNHTTPADERDAKDNRAQPTDTAVARDLGDETDARLLDMRQRVLADGAMWRANLPLRTLAIVRTRLAIVWRPAQMAA